MGTDFESLFVEPRPDEDAWEAFLNLALERIGGDRAPGLTNNQIAELESTVGHQLPFEVGLMLVMGVPLGDGWHQWADPSTEWAVWNELIRDGITYAIEHEAFWFEGWGERPPVVGDQLALMREQFDATVPPLFPIYNHHATPLVAAEGQTNSDGNPVFSVMRADTIAREDDLAAWMHREFDVPLPMWPAEERSFAFWSER